MRKQKIVEVSRRDSPTNTTTTTKIKVKKKTFVEKKTEEI